MPVLRKRLAVATGGGGAMVTRGTVTFGVVDGSHDVYVYTRRLTNADGSLASNPDGTPKIETRGPANTTEVICNDISSTRYDYRSGTLLTAKNGGSLPGNASIVSGYLRFFAVTGANGQIRLSKFGLERSQNPFAVADSADLGITTQQPGRPKTALKTWGPTRAQDWVPEAEFRVDLTDQVEEVRALGTTAITKMHWFWLPYQTGYQEASNYHVYSFERDPTKAPELTVVYEVPA